MQSAFLTPLVCQQISEKGNGVWMLHEPLRYVSKLLNGVITVEAGFVTDFASVPRLPITWLLAGGVADRAAVVHDLLVQCENVCWEVAASVFLEAMEVLGVPWWRRKPMFWAVLYLGRSHKSNNITLKLEPYMI